MQQKEGYFQGTGNINIYWRCWLPDGPVKAVLLIVHGYAEHVSRYINLVNNVVPLGYAVYGLDHQGHGKSEGTRVFVERFQVYLDDLKTFCDMVRGDHQGKKIILYGHSMGALISLDYVRQHPAQVDSLVVSGPAVKLGESITAAAQAMARPLSAIAPKLRLQRMDSTLISHDKSVIEAYDRDPLVYHGKATARLGAEMLSAMTRVQEHLPFMSVPVLILQGSDDRLVNRDGAGMLYEKAGSTDKTLKIYEGFYHDVHDEIGKERVFADLDEWLARHM